MRLSARRRGPESGVPPLTLVSGLPGPALVKSYPRVTLQKIEARSIRFATTLPVNSRLANGEPGWWVRSLAVFKGLSRVRRWSRPAPFPPFRWFHPVEEGVR